jgi:N-acetylglucosaminylphosphatidylinositol deacetylase
MMIPSLIHVLVIAHPDDESMFFLPWIYYTTTRRTNTTIKQQQQQQQQQNNDLSHSTTTATTTAVWLVCLTTGNYDGLGTIRSQELHRVNQNVLHNHGFHKVIILDEPDIMPDHPKQRWDISLVAQQIYNTLQKNLDEEYCGPNHHQRPSIMNFVTFDQYGVSGHVNHIDTYYAVQHLYHQQQLLLQQTPLLLNQSSELLLAKESITVWVLETISNPIRKYIPIGEWIRLVLHSIFQRWYPNHCEMQMILNHPPKSSSSSSSKIKRMAMYRLLQPSLNWYAMSTHQSQFVWYRRLFVLFSIYTYQNVFRTLLLLPPPVVDQSNPESNLLETLPPPDPTTLFRSSQQQSVEDDPKKEL